MAMVDTVVVGHNIRLVPWCMAWLKFEDGGKIGSLLMVMVAQRRQEQDENVVPKIPICNKGCCTLESFHLFMK